MTETDCKNGTNTDDAAIETVAKPQAEVIDTELQATLAGELRTNDRTLPKFKDNEDGTRELRVPDVDRFSEMFGGSKSEAFVHAMAGSCANASGRAEEFRDDKNRTLAIVAEIGPRDGIEAMLATQMAAVHLASIRHSRLMANADAIPQFEIHERAFTKLTRTFTAQMEALRKHRNGGKQTVTVQHVNVEGGGQAIVGDVTHGGGGSDEK